MKLKKIDPNLNRILSFILFCGLGAKEGRGRQWSSLLICQIKILLKKIHISLIYYFQFLTILKKIKSIKKVN